MMLRIQKVRRKVRKVKLVLAKSDEVIQPSSKRSH